jgi:hypothetical protein
MTDQVLVKSHVNTLLFNPMQATGKPDATRSLVEISELVDWCLVVL